jgi:hypothetical protein
MSITRVQEATGAVNNNSNCPVTVSAPTNGNLLVAWHHIAGVYLDSLGSPGSSWSRAFAVGSWANPDPSGVLWYKIASSESTTLTFTHAEARDQRVIVFEYSSSTGWPADPFDVEAHSYVSSTRTTFDTGTTSATAQNDELAICVIGLLPGADLPTGGYSWTNATYDLDSLTGASIGPTSGMGERILTTTGTYSDTATWSGSYRPIAGIATFTPSSGASAIEAVGSSAGIVTSLTADIDAIVEIDAHTVLIPG